MSNAIIQRFLEIGVVDVGGDDNKLDKLAATAGDLSELLVREPMKTSQYTMVAADPNVSASDPAIVEAIAAMKQRWASVSNTFAGTVAVSRALLFQAVVDAARRDDAIAVAFVNAARNTLEYVESGNEQPIWADVVAEMEKKVDARAVAEWATPEMIAIEPIAYMPPEELMVTQQMPTFDDSVLTKSIARAAGPVGGEHNPHNPGQNPPAWAQEFAKRMSVVLVASFDQAFEEAQIAPIDLAGPLGGLSKSVSDHVQNALTAFSGATAGLQRRTNLLWWKESLYSPSAQLSYREVPVYTAAALMALDLHRLVPTYSPASVSAFLNEAIRLLPVSSDEPERSAHALTQGALDTAALSTLRDTASKLVDRPVGRGLVISLIGHFGNGSELSAARLRDLCGFEATASLSPAEWGTWIFRELQAARATREACVPPSLGME